MLPESYSNLLGDAANLIGLATAIFALLAWLQARRVNQNVKREQGRLDQEIEIVIREKESNRCVPVPGRLRRRNFVRSEILGFIGMVPMIAPGRFKLYYVSDEQFFQDLKRIQDAAQPEKLIIECTVDELAQFEPAAVKDC